MGDGKERNRAKNRMEARKDKPLKNLSAQNRSSEI